MKENSIENFKSNLIISNIKTKKVQLNSKEHGEGDHWTYNNDGSHVCNKK
jgi:hypothetical protein